MNLTIATPRLRTWKPVKAHFALAFIGALFVMTALVASGIGQASTPRSSGLSAREIHLTNLVATPDVTYYLVDTQADADRINAAIAESWAEIDGPPVGNEFIVLLTDSPEAEMLAREELALSYEESARGGNRFSVSVVDLRTP